MDENDPHGPHKGNDWVEDAKTDATRQRRIATLVQTLASEAG